ncbi:MAG: iron-containing alcohol dehydrogenase [Crocinitomicaceae bacterium]|nr:MAG: iron-containing alcohol dehydrogenase [Crocinitomicaceae bacterium]
MLNFEIQNPTKIIFGKDQLSKLSTYITSATASTKILLAYGGGSVEKIGLLDKIRTELASFEVIEFGGIEANPEFDTLMQAVEVCRSQHIGFILAVGGGSVIDGVKFISGAVNYDGDPWEVLMREEGKMFTTAVPFGSILTLPATGSEANSGAVISRSSLKEKRTMGGPLFFPVFSFLDPTVVASIPTRQLANGITDAFMHTLEQYITYPTGNRLQEREAEAVLATLIEIAPTVLEKPSDYEAAANLMWCANHALNGNLRCGVPTDWSTHMIGHELTALYGIDHAQSLAIICPRLFEVKFENKKEKLEQYGKRVWNLKGDNIAREAIAKTEEFFQSLGIRTKISDYTNDATDAAAIIRARFAERNWIAMGERQDLTLDEVQTIVENAL